jgi:hypothetical protein
MIDAIGWISLALGGVMTLMAVSLSAGGGPASGGVENVRTGLIIGALASAVWIALVVWWSPLTVYLH